jgi:hypothetical protein
MIATIILSCLISVSLTDAWNGILMNGLTSGIQIFDPSNPTILIPDFNLAKLFGSTAVSLNDRVYFIGGIRNDINGNYTNSVTEFSPQLNNTNNRSSSLNYARALHSAVIVNNTIIVCGGINATQPNGMSSCEQFDVSTQTWNIIASLPVSTYSLSMTTLNHRAYAFGGYNSGEFCKSRASVYMFNGASWVAINFNHMPFALREHTSVAIDNETALICGGIGYRLTGDGCTALSNCFIYNATSDQWRDAPKMAQARQDHSMVVFNGISHIYANYYFVF